MEGTAQLQDALRGRRSGPYASDGKEERLRSAYLCRVGEVVYDYGVEGIWPEPQRVGLEHEDELFLDFAALCMASRVAAELYGTRVPIHSEYTLAMAYLRSALDFATLGKDLDVEIFGDGPSNFNLFEVAVLARMSEKSVRNATQPRSTTTPLRTIRVGNRTLVEPAEALRWLKERRSFVATSLPEDG